MESLRRIEPGIEPESYAVSQLREQVAADIARIHNEESPVPTQTAGSIEPKPHDFYNTENEWKQQGACRGVSPNVFFPEKGKGNDYDTKVKEAKAYCQDCKVRTQCLNFAITTGQEDGVWGGTSPEERKKIKRLRK